MNVVVRVDSSLTIGTGHLARCVALANRLKQRGADVMFACRALPGFDATAIRALGYDVSVLDAIGDHGARDFSDQSIAAGNTFWQTDATAVEAATDTWRHGARVDWAIVDHYRLDARWERRVRSFANRLMVIDDLADRLHDCDLLLDQNFHSDPATRYRGRIPESCRSFFGPAFALLRDEFYQERRVNRLRNGRVSRLLITFGGADFADETSKALAGVLDIEAPRLQVDVVVGSVFPHLSKLEAMVGGRPWIHLHIAPALIAVLNREADLALGAGGISLWERCILGLPAITIAAAANQVEVLRWLFRELILG